MVSIESDQPRRRGLDAVLLELLSYEEEIQSVWLRLQHHGSSRVAKIKVERQKGPKGWPGLDGSGLGNIRVFNVRWRTAKGSWDTTGNFEESRRRKTRCTQKVLR